jgi:prepilin-type N-terminal cleavage/methylation domain-containing protein
MVRLCTQNPRGFTILEVLLVLVLIAAFFVFLATVFHDHDAARQIATGDVLSSHIRYVQMRSMDSDRSWGIAYNQDEKIYWMFREGEMGRYSLPGETTDTVDIGRSGVSIQQGSFRLHFDDRGRPVSDLPFSSDGLLTLTLAMAGQNDVDLVIIANTGFVQWQP